MFHVVSVDLASAARVCSYWRRASGSRASSAFVGADGCDATADEVRDEVSRAGAVHVERGDRALHGVPGGALVRLLVRDEVAGDHEAVLEVVDA